MSGIGPDNGEVGQVWHGALSCENVLRVLWLNDEYLVILAEHIKYSLDEEAVTGAILLRKRSVKSQWHLAEDCPDA